MHDLWTVLLESIALILIFGCFTHLQLLNCRVADSGVGPSDKGKEAVLGDYL